MRRRAGGPSFEPGAIFRRKAIYEELHPETKAEAFKGNQHTGKVASENSAFTTDAAKATGKDKRTIERAAARGEALGPDLADIAGTSLNREGKKLRGPQRLTRRFQIGSMLPFSWETANRLMAIASCKVASERAHGTIYRYLGLPFMSSPRSPRTSWKSHCRKAGGP